MSDPIIFLWIFPVIIHVGVVMQFRFFIVKTNDSSILLMNLSLLGEREV